MKYIILKNHDPIVFGNSEEFSHVAYKINDMAYGEEIVSAGYCALNGIASIEGQYTLSVKCYGEAKELNVKSRGEVDAHMIEKILTQ